MSRFSLALSLSGSLVFFMTAQAFAAETPQPKDIGQAVTELKAVYDVDIKEMSTPPTEDSPSGTPPERLLSQHKLITAQLLKHIGNIGGLDFDILTSSQDWDPAWDVKFGDPVKSGESYLLAIVLDRHTEKSTVTWKFVNKGGSWLIDDATYEEPGEKPFTLRSLKEGD